MTFMPMLSTHELLTTTIYPLCSLLLFCGRKDTDQPAAFKPKLHFGFQVYFTDLFFKVFSWKLYTSLKNKETKQKAINASQLTQHMCVLLLQLACYDQSKELVLATGYLTDNIFTHFLASVFAVSDSRLSQHSKTNIT